MAALSVDVDGKPFFMAGPDDDAGRIMATLASRVGEGKYDFAAPF